MVVDRRWRRVLRLVAKRAVDAAKSLGRVGEGQALSAVLAHVIVGALSARRGLVLGGGSRGRVGRLAPASAPSRQRRREHSDEHQVFKSKKH
jgi:hypothetical protein